MGAQLVAANNKKRKCTAYFKLYLRGAAYLRARARVCTFDFEMIYREWISNNSNAFDDSSRPLPLFSFCQIAMKKKKQEKRGRPRSLVRYYRAWQ